MVNTEKRVYERFYHAYTEKELVALLKTHNTLWFEYIYNKYAGTLYQIILQIVPDTNLADDVLQEAFVKFWHRRDDYDEKKGRLFTWMLNITRNLAIDMTRSPAYKNIKNNERLTDSNELSSQILPAHFDTDFIGLSNFVNDLRPEHRILINLAYFKGYTCPQIAQILGLPLGTVKSRLRQAIAKLKLAMN